MYKLLFETKLTDIKSTDVEGVGTLRCEQDGGLTKIFEWTKNRNATAFTAKQPVCFDADQAGSAAILQKVNSPVTADLMLAAGIAVTAIAASGGNCYGWVQREGYFQDARVRTPATNDIEIGSELVAADGATTLEYQGNAGTAPIYSKHFIALEAVATDSTGTAVVSKDVYISCL
jgi:hypothetical protein